MLLFPGRPTWILCGILVVMNFVDVLLMIVLDLDSPAVNDLAMGPRILSALSPFLSLHARLKTNLRPTNSANVGLSLGHPTVMTSLCGQFTTFSKVVVCAMMIRGRHRGLPYAVDRAVILPGEGGGGQGQGHHHDDGHSKGDGMSAKVRRSERGEGADALKSA